MVEKNEGDDRSMSEILASIRRIVTDEERARRETHSQAGGDAGAEDVLVLTPAMRAGAAGAPEAAEAADAPLDLGLAANRVDAPRQMTDADIEALVRRVVREELKGPIGVEISRKVKASIRDEVRRALEDDQPLI